MLLVLTIFLWVLEVEQVPLPKLDIFVNQPLKESGAEDLRLVQENGVPSSTESNVMIAFVEGTFDIQIAEHLGCHADTSRDRVRRARMD